MMTTRRMLRSRIGNIRLKREVPLSYYCIYYAHLAHFRSEPYVCHWELPTNHFMDLSWFGVQYFLQGYQQYITTNLAGQVQELPYLYCSYSWQNKLHYDFIYCAYLIYIRLLHSDLISLSNCFSLSLPILIMDLCHLFSNQTNPLS